MTNILVIDVGTTGLRAAVVDETLTVRTFEYRSCPPRTRRPGWSSSTAPTWPRSCSTPPARRSPPVGEPISAVGITNQRASVMMWDRTTGEPVGPGLGWQDLRTVGDCIMAKIEHGWALAPNQSATKAAWLLANTPDLDGRDLCIGTIDSWVAWTLCTVRSTSATRRTRRRRRTGSGSSTGPRWNEASVLRSVCPCRRFPPSSTRSACAVRPRRSPAPPPIAGMLGDQQASLIGQGCVRPGRAKITFGSGGMLDVCTDHPTPDGATRYACGRHLSPAALVDRRPPHLGRRGDHALGGDERRVALRRPRPDLRSGGEPRRRQPMRRHRWRGLRPGTDGPGHPPMGLRRPRHAARPHQGLRARARRARRARRYRPSRGRPARCGAAPTPASTSTRCGSTAA